MVYLSLNKSFVEKNLEKWHRAAIDELGEEGKDQLLFYDDAEARLELSESDASFEVFVPDPILGYISLTVTPNSDEWIDLITVLVKRMNKFKAVLEGLK